MAMKARSILTIFLGILLVGCCTAQRRTDPPHPGSVVGWSAPVDKEGRKDPSFVLKKDESTDNGKILIKLIEIIKPGFCAEVSSFQSLARAKFQFVRMSDNKVLCEDILPENGAGFLSNCDPSLASEFGITSMGVMGINLKQGWVHFSVRQY